MTEPHVRYVGSADGTRIATYTMGESEDRPPLIFLPTLGGMGVSFEWAAPAVQAGVGLLAERRRVIWFDARGT